MPNHEIFHIFQIQKICLLLGTNMLNISSNGAVVTPNLDYKSVVISRRLFHYTVIYPTQVKYSLSDHGRRRKSEQYWDKDNRLGLING